VIRGNVWEKCLLIVVLVLMLRRQRQEEGQCVQWQHFGWDMVQIAGTTAQWYDVNEEAALVPVLLTMLILHRVFWCAHAGYR